MNTTASTTAASAFPLPITQAAHSDGPGKPSAVPLEPTSFDRVGLAARCLGAFRLNDIDPITKNWLWPGRIPLGEVTLLAADPGAGKSLVALDIAARISTGAPWPNVRNAEGGGRKAERNSDSNLPPSTLRIPPSSVLLLNIEDHFASTIRPRLEALGADCSRILGMSHVPGEGVFNMPRPLAINRDINRLDNLLREVPDCRLIILDPITAFFGDTSNKSTGNVWKVLSNLAWLAASANLAVLAVSHLRKKEGPPIYRAMGSLAFMACARAAWTIIKDPHDSSRRLLLPIKNNLAESAGGLAFKIESTPAGSTPVVRWLKGAIEARASALLESNRPPGRPDDERQYATDWLRMRLSGGASSVREIRSDAEAHCITYATLRRAFRELGATAFQPPNVLHGPWMWKLPPSDAQNPNGEFCASDHFPDEFADVVSK